MKLIQKYFQVIVIKFNINAKIEFNFQNEI